MKNNNGPKILFLDIETAPMLSYVWGLWKQFIGLHQVESDWYILTWAAKWGGEKKVLSDSLIKHKKTYANNKEDDKEILVSLLELLNQADIVVTHNGNRFDLPRINSRALYNNLPPVSPYKSVDTLHMAKSTFGFSSNKLDYLTQKLGVGGKLKHEGFDLWRKCLQGNKTAWDTMLRYNKQDVVILENIYEKLSPWYNRHPNVSIYVEDEQPMCILCGSTSLGSEGHAYTSLGKFKRYRCKDCGKWMRGRTNLLTKEKRKGIKTNAI